MKLSAGGAGRASFLYPFLPSGLSGHISQTTLSRARMVTEIAQARAGAGCHHRLAGELPVGKLRRDQQKNTRIARATRSAADSCLQKTVCACRWIPQQPPANWPATLVDSRWPQHSLPGESFASNRAG